MNHLFHLYAFYLLAALAIGIYRQWVDGKLSLYNKLVFAPILIIFTAVDIFLNYTLLVLIFGLPEKNDYTISARFKTYRTSEYSYKRYIANFVCDRLSEIDPSGRHC